MYSPRHALMEHMLMSRGYQSAKLAQLGIIVKLVLQNFLLSNAPQAIIVQMEPNMRMKTPALLERSIT